MILGAGLGTRLRPLTELRPKVALPVRGIPLIAYPLHLLAHHGVTEVVINLHHLPEAVREAARTFGPPGVAVRFSQEPELLDTGGGIRRVADFLAGSDPCLVLAGDMILDVDLGALVERHTSRGDAATLLLSDDDRGGTFGTIGIDGDGRVRRIAGRFDLGGETRRGVYVSVTVVSAAALRTLPDRPRFGHLDHWLAPRLAAGADDIRGEIAAPGSVTWLPVGTQAEYLDANLRLPPLSFLEPDRAARLQGTRFASDVIVGAGARVDPGASLQRSVVWDGEQVPAGLVASDGVFAGGRFHPLPEPGEGA